MPAYGPLAADGAGRLLWLLDLGDGYGVAARSAGGGPGQGAGGGSEILYRRKGAAATSLAIGPDGSFCVGLASGIDCVDAQGRITHLEGGLLTGILSLAWSPDGHLWALRGAGGGTTGLQLVRVAPGFRHVQPVLTFRQGVAGSAGNGLATAPDGSALVPVVENGVHRVLRVEPGGRFHRVADFWDLGGGIAVDVDGTLYLDGVKRPQSSQEQRNPQDVVFAQPAAGQPYFAARFPTVPGGTRRSGLLALGGDGILYLVRHQRVRVEGVPAREMPVLWRVELGRPGLSAGKGRTIGFRIPFIGKLTDPRLPSADYAGPLLVGRGQPLVLEGMNFEGKPGSRRVLIGGVPAPVEAWTDGRIQVRVPQGAPGGGARVEVAIDHVVSDAEMMEVKTPEVPGWFQIGSPGMAAALRGNMGITGYNARIVVAGTTDRGEPVHRDETMEVPGLYHVRLPNGRYRVTYDAAYVYQETRYDLWDRYVGTAHVPVRVPQQSIGFEITDGQPITVWMPDMLGLGD